MIKKCRWCGKEFEITEQEKVYCSQECRNIGIKHGHKWHQEHRKEANLRSKNYYEENKEELKAKSRKYQTDHKELIKEQRKDYLKKYNEEHKEERKKYQQEHKESHNNANKKYDNKHKEERKQYRKEHKEEMKEYLKKYYQEHKTERKEYNKEYLKNPINKLIHYCRTRINIVLRNNKKANHTIKLFGCTKEFLKQHLENQFKEGMGWQNYGKWHVDHIIPCASFDFSKKSEQYKCFHYSNLQPLWAEDNLSKGAKIT